MSVYQLKKLMIVVAAIGTLMAVFTVVHAQNNEDVDTVEPSETFEIVEIVETAESSETIVPTEVYETEVICTEDTSFETEVYVEETASETEVSESETETIEPTSVYDYIDSLTTEEAEYYYRNFFEIREISVEELASYDDETFNAVMAEWDYAGMRAGLDANDLV